MTPSEPREDAVAVLREIETYFDERADAEYFTDSAAPVGNEEMRHLVAVRSLIAALAQQGAEPVGYANPDEYEAFVSGQNHTFVVYRHGVHGKDAAIYAAPTGAPR